MELKLLALAALPALAVAQDTEYVWGSVVVTLFGDRIPLLAKDYSTLTALGAEQMNSAGAMFRGRYLTPADADSGDNTTVVGINPTIVDSLQIQLLSMQDVFVQQSAQAFMNGLYPPTTSTNFTSSGQGNVGGPDGGLQYPQYYFASSWDPNYIYLNGSYDCPNFDNSVASYESSSNFTSQASDSQAFYSGVASDFTSAAGELTGSPLWFGNAYAVWDWLQYQQTHANTTGADIPDGTLGQARALADAYMTGVYADTTDDSGIRAVGGATLAGAILETLYSNVQTNGSEYKLGLYFVGVEPFISLAALLGLPGVDPSFNSMPALGSSLVFEMYTPGNDAVVEDGVPAYPTQDDAMRVRMLFRNGTASTLQQQPLFGAGTSTVPDLGLDTFVNNMTSISLTVVADWCTMCSSPAVWCAYYTDGQDGLSSNDDTSGNSSSGGSTRLSPAVAGVIGAVVALAVAAILFLVAFLCFGLRLRRAGRPIVPAAVAGKGAKSHNRQGSSGLGGFKGGEKLASDPDLPRGGGDEAAFGAAVIKDPTGSHRRVESWELREGRRRQSIDSQRDGDVIKETDGV